MGNVAYSQASIGVITFCCQVYTFISIKRHFTKKKDFALSQFGKQEDLFPVLVCFVLHE